MSQEPVETRRDGKKRLLPLWMVSSSEKPILRSDDRATSEGKQSKLVETPKVAISKQLPVLTFMGQIHYYTNIGEASVACEEIRSLSKSQPLVMGFDLEWTPNFQSKREPCTAVIQICPDHFNCYIIHLAVMNGFPHVLRLLIEDSNIIKVGVGIENDMWKLGRDFLLPARSIIAESVVDLSTLANQVLKCSQHWSLGRLVERVLNLSLPKDPGIRCGNWNRYPLTPEQLNYAALDAYASFILYEDLKSMEAMDVSSGWT